MPFFLSTFDIKDLAKKRSPYCLVLVWFKERIQA